MAIWFLGLVSLGVLMGVLSAMIGLPLWVAVILVGVSGLIVGPILRRRFWR